MDLHQFKTELKSILGSEYSNYNIDFSNIEELKYLIKSIIIEKENLVTTFDENSHEYVTISLMKNLLNKFLLRLNDIN